MASNILVTGMERTESNWVCAGCDRPFMPSEKADLCIRCRERASDHLRGAGVVMWMFAATAAMAFALVSCHGATVVTDALLGRVAWAESRNNPRAVGKLGEVGAYQLRPIAIREVNRIYRTRYTVADARTAKAREIARRYLLICESRVTAPTAERVYLKYKGAL